jgi:hypothetical protein
MSRRVHIERRRREPEEYPTNPAFSQDFVLAAIPSDASRWERLKIRLLLKLGRIHPPDRPASSN